MSFGVQVDVVRVFTDARGGSGNPLGIVMSSAASQGREQSIAEALGYSETVFIGEITPDAAQVRIFTPARELPFAGHPSVGTAWWLARRGTPVAALEVPAGRVVIDIDGEDVAVRARPGWTPDFAFRQLGSPAEIDALDPATFTEGHHCPASSSWQDFFALKGRGCRVGEAEVDLEGAVPGECFVGAGFV
ncbi:PhzF family phenazine biosynthesis protein, partial [Microbacterium ginsengisoli]|uniref:PhzF family phenazine biosynthesis protein n=1 Tax=Microbacterium ginsengisoli TaxID=400772 RepID=UPI000ADFE1BB